MTMQTEEYTIKNESNPKTIPNEELVTVAKKTTPKAMVKHAKPLAELIKLRAYAHEMTIRNQRKLTICPKCDNEGYAKYRVRSSNDKLILFYVHSNEPPIGTKDGKMFGRKHDWPTYRQCWIGNVLSEEEFMESIGGGKEEEEAYYYQRHEANKDYSKDFNLRVKIPADIVKQIDEQRGNASRKNFLLAALKEVLGK